MIFIIQYIGPTVKLPQSPKQMKATFELYTPKNPNKSDKLQWDNTDKYYQTKFNKNFDTKIIVHGYLRHPHEPWQEKLKKTIFQFADYNVIIVGWKGGALTTYSQAVSNARVIGKMIGILIENLSKTFNVTLDSFHLLGHSLGGHVVGFAGKHFNNTINKLGRITGLDPAGPFFEGLPYVDGRLWHTDAEFVDVIHTDIKEPNNLGFGIKETCGHFDLYVNGGYKNPECDPLEKLEIFFGTIGSLVYSQCNHYQVVYYLIESLSTPMADPVAHLCDSYESYKNGKCDECMNNDDCVILNGFVRHYPIDLYYTKGKKFFLQTAAKQPHFRYQYSIEVTMSSNFYNSNINNINEDEENLKLKINFIDRKARKEQFIFIDNIIKIKNNNNNNNNKTAVIKKHFVLNTNPEHLHRINTNQNLYVELIKVTAISFVGGSNRIEPMQFISTLSTDNDDVYDNDNNDNDLFNPLKTLNAYINMYSLYFKYYYPKL